MEWIDINDQKPTECAVYLVTYKPKDYDIRLVTTCHYDCDSNGDYRFLSTSYLHPDMTSMVIAWMPEPQPYNG